MEPWEPLLWEYGTKSPAELHRGFSFTNIWLSYKSNVVASWMHLHECRCIQEHRRGWPECLGGLRVASGPIYILLMPRHAWSCHCIQGVISICASIGRLVGRPSILSVYCTQYTLYSVYTAVGVCCSWCMLYLQYAVLGVYCIQCMLYTVYAVSSVLYLQCILFAVYAVHSVCCAQYPLYMMLAHDQVMEISSRTM